MGNYISVSTVSQPTHKRGTRIREMSHGEIVVVECEEVP